MIKCVKCHRAVHQTQVIPQHIHCQSIRMRSGTNVGVTKPRHPPTCPGISSTPACPLQTPGSGPPVLQAPGCTEALEKTSTAASQASKCPQGLPGFCLRPSPRGSRCEPPRAATASAGTQIRRSLPSSPSAHHRDLGSTVTSGASHWRN